MAQESSDTELIQAYLAGDAESFNTLYDRYKRQLYAYLNRLLNGHTANADDLFQQTWLKAIANLEKYRDREIFLAWLMRIAHNLTVDYFRRAERRAEEVFDEAYADKPDGTLFQRTARSPGEELEESELEKAIRDAVQELPPELREVFLLRQEDVPFREIAEIQNCSINTCLARMRYALDKLRARLQVWTKTESR